MWVDFPSVEMNLNNSQLKLRMRVVRLLLLLLLLPFVSSGCVGAALHLLSSKCHHGAIMPSRQQPPEILKTPTFRLLERNSWLKQLELLVISLCRSAAWGNTLQHSATVCEAASKSEHEEETETSVEKRIKDGTKESELRAKEERTRRHTGGGGGRMEMRREVRSGWKKGWETEKKTGDREGS